MRGREGCVAMIILVYSVTGLGLTVYVCSWCRACVSSWYSKSTRALHVYTWITGGKPHCIHPLAIINELELDYQLAVWHTHLCITSPRYTCMNGYIIRCLWTLRNVGCPYMEICLAWQRNVVSCISLQSPSNHLATDQCVQ